MTPRVAAFIFGFVSGIAAVGAYMVWVLAGDEMKQERDWAMYQHSLRHPEHEVHQRGLGIVTGTEEIRDRIRRGVPPGA